MTTAYGYADHDVPLRASLRANNDHAESPAAGDSRGRRAQRWLRALPHNIDAQMRKNPYRALGVAGVVGFGGGVVLGSRLLRSAAGSALTVAALDLLWSYVMTRTAEARRHTTTPQRG
jgi:hypothetical protein